MVDGKYLNYMSAIPQDAPYSLKADSIIGELSRIIEPTVTIQPNDPLYQGEEITMLLMPMLVNN